MSLSSSQSVPSDPLIGTLIEGRFRVLETIAEGSMGRVYAARQESIGRIVALKVMEARGAEGEAVYSHRFHREANLLGLFAHPNIIVIHDFGQTDFRGERLLFLVMEHLEGQTLRALLDREERLAPRRAVRIVKQICSALVDVHAAGMVHRDLKPANIMLVNRGGEPDVVKLIDFGLVKQIESRSAEAGATLAHNIVGSPLYMAPEQFIKQETTTRSEVYSVGVVLYELLTGQTPFVQREGHAVTDVLLQHATALPPTFAEHTPELRCPQLEGIVRRCLEKQPEVRYDSMRALYDALDDHETSSRNASQETAAAPRAKMDPEPRLSPSERRARATPPRGTVAPPRAARESVSQAQSQELSVSFAGVEVARTTFVRERGSEVIRRLARTSSFSVLLMDSPGSVVGVARDVLRHVGCSVVVARTREEAQDHLLVSCPGLVLLPARFEEQDASSLIVFIREQASFLGEAEPEVFLLFDDFMEMSTASVAGVDGCFRLPGERDELRKELHARTVSGAEVLGELDATRFDLDVVRRAIEVSPEQLAQTIDQFMGRAPEWLAHLSSALDARDFEGPLRDLREIYGGAQALGLVQVTSGLSRLNDALVHRRVHAGQALCQDLERRYTEAFQALMTLRAAL